MFQRQHSEVTIVQLAEACGYSSFGGWIAAIKKKYSLTQGTIARSAKRYFEAVSIKPLPSPATIGRLERDDPDRYPHFRELEPFYRALVERVGLDLPLSVEERELYLYFARKRIEERQRKERISEEQWQTLGDRLLLLTPNPKSRFHLVRGVVQKRDEQERSDTPLQGQEEDPNSRRKRAIQNAKDTDLRLFLEREEWVEQMLHYLEMTPQMKLVVVQGGGGTGKSYATAFLLQHLDKHEHSFLIPYLFEPGNGKTSEDHLDEFLATTLSDLTYARVGDESKQRPLETRIDDLFAELHRRSEKQQKVIFVLDNAHLIFPSAGAWSPAWSLFLGRFARDSHSATMYLFTRVWPGWDHPLPFVERTNLPALSLAAAVSIWHHFHFGDVPQDTLEKISVRCGCNPQMIELLVAQCQSCMFGVRWKRNTTEVSTSASSPNTQKLEALLAQDSIFTSRMDTKTRTVLQSAMSSELSHQAKAMLECLACSPLGLPFCLLAEEFAGVEDAFNDLVNASLIDLTLAASERAVIAPFAREAVLLALANDGRRDAIESRVTDLYSYWLSEVQDFRDDREKASLIAEMVVRYIRQRQLLKATELFVSFGWLCSLFGQVSRIRRVFDEYVSTNRGRDEDAGHEIGRLILEHHTRLRLNGMRDEERDQIYQGIYNLVTSEEVQLPANCELTVAQHMFLVYLRGSLFVEARQMFEETLARLQQSNQLTSEIYASYLYYKSRLLARWWDKLALAQDQNEIERLKQECVAVLEESVALWRKCLRKNPLPLQMHYVNFKLARSLNDYAYRMRLCGNLEVAQEAIEESIRLKRASGTLQHSVAISLSEYSQILVMQGKMRQALAGNQDAIDIIEQLIQEGNTAHTPNLGMFLVERADILRAQARLEEARLLLEQAVVLIGDQQSRQEFCSRAKRDIQEINHILAQPRGYHLDDRWFSRYYELSSFDNLAWMAHAGPLNAEEQDEWEQLLPHRTEEQASSRMAALIVQSRRREFDLCQVEDRAPRLWYPMVPLDEAQRRLNGFEQLRKEIESEESNAIVRSLYLDIIQERLTILRQCQATALGDQQTVWQCNLDLYGKPDEQEVYIALQMYHKMLSEVREDEPAWSVAQEALRQLQFWGLSSQEVERHCVFAQDAVLPFRAKESGGEQEFSHIVAQRFFQDVLLHEYHVEGWRVEIAPARDGVYIDVDLRTLFLPPKPLSLEKIRQLLAEEIEVHAYRSFSGQHSPLRLLGSGLAGYSATEEGLAAYYEQQMALQVNGGKKPSTWIGTLAIGLATGILTPALSFRELVTFFEKFLLIHRWLTVGGLWDTTVKWAKEQAWARAARTFRGIPDLGEKGCCSLKDRIYLQGYMDVTRFLEKTNDEGALYVGKAAIKHLDLLAELNIVTPYYPHRRLALAPDLLIRLSQYKD